MSPERGTLLAAALIAALAANPGQAQPPAPIPPQPAASQPETPKPEPYVVRVGYTAFKKPEKVREVSTLQSVEMYLGTIEGLHSEHPMRFELTLGNYYQIWSWFKTGQIDAAVVSPFMAMLLERDSQAVSLLEFAEGTGEEAAAHFPIVGATGQWRDAPLEGLNQYLESLLNAARQGEPESKAVREEIKKIRREIRLDLVAHLSASGFIMPSLYVQAWLESSERGRLEETLKERFWRLFFESAHMTLVHGDEPARPPVSTIQFSYEHAGREQHKDFGMWVKYKAGTLPADAPSIPNDVLLVRRQIVEKLRDKNTADFAQPEKVFLAPEIQQSFRAQNGRYAEIRLFNTAIHSQFREAVSQLFSREAKNRELARLNIRWYERGLFDFTIDETMAFLRQDQKNSGIEQLAVVLSGGGVKSLYQTVLLDHLYGLRAGAVRQLRNMDEEPPTSTAPAQCNATDPAPLEVHTIIGTSGGAMLAFFAAQLPQIQSLGPIVETTSGKRLFPWTGLPRLLSILVLLGLLYAVLLTARTFDWWGYGNLARIPVDKSSLGSVMTVALLLLLAGAATIVTTRSEYMESAPTAEALFYILTGVVAHFAVTCIARASRQRSARQVALGRLAGLGLAFGVQLLVIAAVARHWIRPGSEELHKVSLPGLSVLASAGVLVIAAALATSAASGRWGLTVQGVRGYVTAMAAVAVTTVAAFLPLIALTFLGLGTLLELTTRYWLGLVAAGIVASVGMLYLAQALHTRPMGFLREGFVELMRDRRGVTTTRMMASIVSLFAVCIAFWGLFVTPAVYSNVEAVRSFNQSLSEEQLWTGRFRTNLVVTGTLLREARCSPTHTISEGGLYFCFEGGPEGCGSPVGGQWQVFRKPAPARAVDAVFASGSAFPVFPPHLAHLPDGCEVRLVDGGYAHNVPLEAASITEARQVLILNASPDPLDAEERPLPGWRRFLQEAQLNGGQLLRSSPDVLSFMFSRAQELDRNIGGSLVVASLTPRPEDGWWPFLLDFRPSIRERMLKTANQDITLERRIGHVLSWGRPVLLSWKRPAVQPASPAP
jgi:predicted acylesterase/phospholipase RssA/ABC-type phosphate/phosphonate transport system substrate-binding protein